MFRPLFALSLLTISLQGCWVPQVVQGVRPQIFASAAPSNAPTTSITLESKIVGLGTRLIAIAKRTSGSLALSANLAAHRQSLENHLYYNVKASGDFSGWSYDQGVYSYYDPYTSASYSLQLLDSTGGKPGFDVLGFGSYGASPLPAKAFPGDVRSYSLNTSQKDAVAGDTLNLFLTGSWPIQIPLRGSYLTTLSGTGENKGHALFKDMSLRIDGKSSSDGTLVEGQIGFSADIDGRIYNGFGTLDAAGFVGTIQIEQNGVPVAQIVRRDKRWDVEVNGKIMASGD